jgi:N-acetylneuraminate 9-O-acetyltransferase
MTIFVLNSSQPTTHITAASPTPSPCLLQPPVLHSVGPRMARIVWQLLALSAVVLGISLFIHKAVLDRHDPYRCHALRDRGHWLGQTRDQFGSIQPHYWQPSGCILHEYSAREIEECLDCSRLLFAGDSNVRRLFWATAIKVNKTQAEHARLYAEKHGDLHFEVGCSKLQFLWDPYLNSSALRNEIVTSGNFYRSDLTLQRNGSYTSIIAGGGLWHASYLGDNYLTAFKNNVGALFSLLRNHDIIKPTALLGSQRNLLLLMPVLSAKSDMLDEDRNATLTPERLAMLNSYLLEPSVRSHIEILWSFSSMLQPEILAYEEDGIHLLMEIVEKQADIILNLRCNAMAALQHYPYDKTCCTGTTPYNMVQVIMLILALSAIVLKAITAVSTVLGVRYAKLQRQKEIRALAVMSLVCIYCYLSDRTHLFQKAQKTTDQETFLWMLGFIMVLGALTMGRSTTGNGVSEKDSGTCTNCGPYLTRDQTEEWKGWMQFVVLLYHYFGMSKVLWVYQLVRLMVASYLFITGFGHALFFLKTNDFSLRRVAVVLIRLNMLSVVLAYGMRTDYSFYYFPALSSFWFLVIFLILRCGGGRRVGRLQMGISLLLLRIAIQQPGFLEKIVEILQSACRMHIDVDELRFRISLDTYVVYAGVFFAIGYAKFTCASPLFPYSLTNKLGSRQQLLQSVIALAACVIIALYVLLAVHFSDKYAYNEWHAVISPFPVLAFVVLRNATPLVRTYHSWLFAWLGRCSLETFILQYHIWLAADTKGLLRLGLCSSSDGLNGPCGRWCHWLEFVVITVFFLWTSWEASKATNVLTEWIVGPAKPQPALGETAAKIDKPSASTFMKAENKLGLEFRLALILAILVVGNWLWK